MSSYNYTKIRDLTAGAAKVNVIGVVADFRAPAKSRGNDFSCCIELVDEGEQKLKCILFNSDSKLLPQHCSRGDVVCLRRIDIKMFNQNLQALCPRYGSWIMCRKESPGIVPLTCKDNFTFTDIEKNRIRTLRQWAATSSLSTASAPDVFTQQPSTSAAALAGVSNTAATTLLRPVPVKATSVQQRSAFGPVKNSHQLQFAMHQLPQLKKIAHLKVGDKKVSVCGIVKYFKPPMRSKGPDYYMTVTIVDESSPEDGLNCVVFNPTQSKLPPLKHTGEVILVKGLQINSYQNSLQAMGHERTKVSVFSSNPGDSFPGEVSRLEKQRISALRTWSSEQALWASNAKLDSVGMQHYFDLTCRVAATYLNPTSMTCVLTVFDGTDSKLDCKELSPEEIRKAGCHYASDAPLCCAYSNFLHDVFVDGSTAFEAEPGQYVRLIHVIAEPVDVNDSGSTKVCLKINKDTFYGGGVVILTENKEIEDFKRGLPDIVEPQPAWRTPTRTLPASASVVYSSHPEKVSSLKDVLDGKKGEKFRVRVKVLMIGSGRPIEEFSQLRCTKCRQQFPTPKEDADNPLTVGHPCPFCSDGSDEREAVLKYVYVVSLRVQDDTAKLKVYLNSDSRDSFLPQLEPTNLYIDHPAKEALLVRFYYMTGGNDPFKSSRSHPMFSYPRPWLDCCILVYESQERNKCFQFCDTVLCEWDLP